LAARLKFIEPALIPDLAEIKMMLLGLIKKVKSRVVESG